MPLSGWLYSIRSLQAADEQAKQAGHEPLGAAGVEQRKSERGPHQNGMAAQASGRKQQEQDADNGESRDPVEIGARSASPAVQGVSQEAGVKVNAGDEAAECEKY